MVNNHISSDFDNILYLGVFRFAEYKYDMVFRNSVSKGKYEGLKILTNALT